MCFPFRKKKQQPFDIYDFNAKPIMSDQSSFKRRKRRAPLRHNGYDVGGYSRGGGVRDRRWFVGGFLVGDASGGGDGGGGGGDGGGGGGGGGGGD
jgi:hypothetical protein